MFGTAVNSNHLGYAVAIYLWFHRNFEKRKVRMWEMAS